MALPRWRRTGGADFVFFHAHPGFEWDDVEQTTEMQTLLCNDFQWATMVAVEQGQRWRCPTYTPRSTILAPYASTEVLSSLESRVPDEERDVLAYFRCGAAPPSRGPSAARPRGVGRGAARRAGARPGGAGAAATPRPSSWASSSGSTSCSR